MQFRTDLTIVRAALCFLVVAIASPAYAASFYVAFNTITEKCSIMITEPDGETMVALGSPYASYGDADAAMREMDKCSSHTGL